MATNNTSSVISSTNVAPVSANTNASVPPAGNASVRPQEATETGEAPKTDMAKVNYFLTRPGLLMDQLPKNRRAELAEHVGRRSVSNHSSVFPRAR